MRAAVLTRPGEVDVVQRPDPSPAADEVLVRVHAVGVCGSDTHYFDHGRIGRFVVESPLVLGHETSGVIESVG
ncbi:MAG: alcohol dehydrogenase catalytic domain-containing protein, partial [Pedococcus sp.]